MGLYVTSHLQKMACWKLAKEHGWLTSHVTDDNHVANDILVAADSLAEFEKKERERKSLTSSVASGAGTAAMKAVLQMVMQSMLLLTAS